ncbi:MAG TPA: BON domain-containing protein [Fimbriiglobus sp.]|nr:BON domain-containing protein [Fimbriiglobus sp.]
MAKRILGVVLAVGIIGGALAGSKKSDADTLARIGEVVGQRVKAALPEASKVAGPLTAFKPGDALPVEETVRIRIHADKKMAGTNVTVASGATSGEVKLHGLVKDRGQWARAAELAGQTAGVETVVNEIAVPE